MLIRDLLVLLIKTFGLASGLLLLFNSVPFSLLVGFSDNDGLSQFYIVCSLLISFGVVYFTVFHADKLVGVLKLDKGFHENRIEFGNIDIRGAAWIAVMIVGLVLMVTNLFETLLDAQAYFSDKIKQSEAASSTGRTLLLSLLKTVCGYLMVSNARSLIALVLPVQQNDNDTINTLPK